MLDGRVTLVCVVSLSPKCFEKRKSWILFFLRSEKQNNLLLAAGSLNL